MLDLAVDYIKELQKQVKVTYMSLKLPILFDQNSELRLA
jgi:hypothetical protein